MLLWSLLGGLAAAVAGADPFVLHSLSRTLEVGGSTARATSALVLEYTGSGGSDEALAFHVPVHLLGKVSYVEVKHGKGDSARLLPVRSGRFEPSLCVTHCSATAHRAGRRTRSRSSCRRTCFRLAATSR